MSPRTILFYKRFAVVFLFLTALASVGSSMPPQEGVIDLEDIWKAKIAEFSHLLESDSDMRPERQVVLIEWLIELYDSTSNIDGMKKGYEKILSFYPYDVRILNQFARFYMEKQNDYATAESLLTNARIYARLIEAHDVDRGTTQQLLASIRLNEGEVDAAIDHLKTADHLFIHEPILRESAMRQLVRTYARAGRYEDAAGACLDLIAITVRATPEDEEELSRYLKLSGKETGERAEELIRDALEQGLIQRKQNIASVGGEWIQLSSDDGYLLEGTFYDGERAGAVLMLPDPKRSRNGYRVAAQLLFTEGIRSLSIDFRGCGGSRSRHGAHPAETDHSYYPADAKAAFDYLRKRTSLPEHRIVIVAEGHACSIAEIMIAQNSLDSPVIYLSPQFRTGDRELYNAIAFHPNQPLFFLDSMEDRTAAYSISFFEGVKSFDRLERLSLTKAGHGTRILAHSPDALPAIVTWLKKILELD